MSFQSRRPLMPPPSRKRKEREAFYDVTSSKSLAPLTAVNSVKGSEPAQQQQQPMCSNRLLAGYMAYEFLTKGTLLGERFEPARAEAIPVNSTDSKRKNQQKADADASWKPNPKPQSYVEVASLLKGDGAHLPGIINPTQLARWIQM